MRYIVPAAPRAAPLIRANRLLFVLDLITEQNGYWTYIERILKTRERIYKKAVRQRI
jgi:hypothetical protein